MNNAYPRRHVKLKPSYTAYELLDGFLGMASITLFAVLFVLFIH